MTKIVAIVGDSLSLPREGTAYRETYPFLLSEMLGDGYEVVNLSRPRNDTGKISPRSVLTYQPDYTVIHLGIVDSAPRLFGKTADFILSHVMPEKLALKWIRFKSRHRLWFTRIFPKTYVSLKEFARNIFNFERTFPRPIFVGIMDTSPENKKRSYGFFKNIYSYNSVLSMVGCIGMPAFYGMDGIHLNKQGHRFLAMELARKIKLCGPR